MVLPKLYEKYILTITFYTHEGHGVGRVDGFVVMIPGALRCEVCEVEITCLKKRYALGRLCRVITPSDCRQKSFCEYYEMCGGCNLQHMKYEETLFFKEEAVKNVLSRVGKVAQEDLDVFEGIVGMNEPYSYRNVVRYHADRDGRLGFYEAGTNQVIDIEHCLLQSDESNELYAYLREYLKVNDLLYIEDIVIRVAKGALNEHETGENKKAFADMRLVTMLILVVDEKTFIDGNEKVCTSTRDSILTDMKRLADCIRGRFDSCKSVYLSVKSDRTHPHKAVGDENILMAGDKGLIDWIGDMAFFISPESFFQVNPVQTKKLYAKVLEYAGLKGNEKVYDLFCGVGSITLFLARLAGEVTGIEMVSSAIDDAFANKDLNGLTNVKFVNGDVKEYLRLSTLDERAEVIVVDPPRTGCDKELLVGMAQANPDRIVYVSCNPATLARDIAVLGEEGFEVMKVCPVDMFPWTEHVECVVLLSKLVPQSHINVKVEFGEGDGKIPIDQIMRKAKEYESHMKN